MIGELKQKRGTVIIIDGGNLSDEDCYPDLDQIARQFAAKNYHLIVLQKDVFPSDEFMKDLANRIVDMVML